MHKRFWCRQGHRWEVSLGNPIERPDRAVLGADGVRVLMGGEDRTARLWDASTGQQLRVWPGHESGVGDVASAAAGKRVRTRTARRRGSTAGRGVTDGPDSGSGGWCPVRGGWCPVRSRRTSARGVGAKRRRRLKTCGYGPDNLFRIMCETHPGNTGVDTLGASPWHPRQNGYASRRRGAELPAQEGRSFPIGISGRGLGKQQIMLKPHEES